MATVALQAIEDAKPLRVRTVGAQPRPRILIVGDVPAEVAKVVTRVAPTCATVAIDEFGRIRQREWDVVVTTATINELRVEARLHVVVFAATDRQIIESGGMPPGWSVEVCEHDVACHEFHEFDDVPDELAHLVATTLIPYFQRLADDRYWTLRCSPRLTHLALATDGDKHPLGLIYQRPPSALPRIPNRTPQPLGTAQWELPAAGGVRIVVPLDVARRDVWTQQTLRYLARIDPDRCGGLRDWDDDPRWQTTAEHAARQALDGHLEARTAAITRLDATTNQLTATASAARDAGRAGPLRLLTGNGDELVAATRDALRAVGFEITEPDEDPARDGDKLEDLQLRDPAAPAWVCLIEVRGYGGGAKVTDLIRIGRFCERYAAATGAEPTSRWYIVNHFRNDPPEHRPTPLTSNPSDVAVFTGAGGLVIDSRALFQLLQRHATDQSADLAALRAALRDRTGTLTTADDLAAT